MQIHQRGRRFQRHATGPTDTAAVDSALSSIAFGGSVRLLTLVTGTPIRACRFHRGTGPGERRHEQGNHYRRWRHGPVRGGLQRRGWRRSIGGSRCRIRLRTLAILNDLGFASDVERIACHGSIDGTGIRSVPIALVRRTGSPSTRARRRRLWSQPGHDPERPQSVRRRRRCQHSQRPRAVRAGWPGPASATATAAARTWSMSLRANLHGCGWLIDHRRLRDATENCPCC